MTAKISDLCVARIVDFSQQATQRMTSPSTRAFMPPEVLVDNPDYGLGVDIFFIMIHIFTGQWPTVNVQHACIKGDRLIPYIEAERR